MVRVTSILVILALMACPSPAAAEQRKHEPRSNQTSNVPFKWWADEHIQKTLQLTPNQIEKIEATFRHALPAQRELWASLQAAERELSELLSAPVVDEERATSAIERAEFFRYKLNEKRAKVLLQMHQHLTPTQRKTFAELAEHQRKLPRRFD